MAQEQTFYTEDTCCLTANPSKIGLVDRTYSDVGTHHPDARQHYPEGLERHKGLTKRQYDDFLYSGIPPRGSVVVTWAQFPGENVANSTLILESALSLVDRALHVGDVVKGAARDAMSGTIIRTSMKCNLLPPQPWAAPRQDSHVESSHRNQDNLSKDATQLLREIPARELKFAGFLRQGTIVIYKDWIGRVQETWEDISIRLRNGSVVVVEDPEALEPVLLDEPYEVGDFVIAKKGNLRRGRWIFGAFDANALPQGHVAHVRITSVEIRWLLQRYPQQGVVSTPEPPYHLDQDLLDSGELFVYDRYKPLETSSGPSDNSEHSSLQFRHLSPRYDVGDRVRFRNLAEAAGKYAGTGSHGKLNQIPKVATLGYDINVFLVSRTSTEATVLWQDSTVSTAAASNFVPDLDVDDDNVWPGEVVVTKENISKSAGVFQPSRVGVVQSVNAQERMATIKWFQAQVSLTVELTIVLPGSYLGCAIGPVEAVSLYEIKALPALLRGIGDIVSIVPIHDIRNQHALYTDVLSIMQSPTQSKDWVGEIVDLGLDGLATVRLGASSTGTRHVRIPWECTQLALTMTDGDELEDEDEVMSEGSSYASDTDDMFSDAESVWRDENDEIVEEDGVMDEGADWLTDEDDEIDDEEGKEREELATTDISMLGPDAKEQAVMEDQAVDQTGTQGKISTIPPTVASAGLILPYPGPHHGDVGSFSYSSMFPKGTDSEGDVHSMPEGFSILEGMAPRDHHFSGQNTTADGQRLRRIQKEHKILRSSLPDGVYVRTWESSLDLIRVLMLGPLGTPYEHAPFLFDLHLDSSFPFEPPKAFFHSWTDGTEPANPNLYTNGKICLSLLGTWPGDERNETWSSKSTILQIIVSILGLVLVKEPYFNEAGYEVRAGSAESEIASAMYSERTFFNSRAFIAHALKHPIAGFEQEVKAIYLVRRQGYPQLLVRAICGAIEVIRRSRNHGNKENSTNASGRSMEVGRQVSLGALSPLKKRVDELLGIQQHEDEKGASWLREELHGRHDSGDVVVEGQLFQSFQVQQCAERDSVI